MFYDFWRQKANKNALRSTKLSLIISIKYLLHKNKVDFSKKMTGFYKKKKKEYCALKTSLVSHRLPSLFMFSSLYETISDWLRGTVLTAGFL